MQHPFYGKEVLRDSEQAYIQKLLRKYRGRLADENLKKEIYEELHKAKVAGIISIPFKVSLVSGIPPLGPYVEVLLDSKV